MESTRPIRALVRGLDALTALNSRPSATVSAIAAEVKLPRTTVYRVLETLCGAGLAVRDAADDRYRLTPAINSLSDGFNDDAWVLQEAMPRVNALARETVWPLALGTRQGDYVQIRACTDRSSPLCAERLSPGSRLSLLGSALGRIVLSQLSHAERSGIYDHIPQGLQPDARLAKNPAELETQIAEIAAQGFATSASARRASDDLWLAVPVAARGSAPAALGLRVASRALSAAELHERFLRKLQNCARDIQAAVAARASSVE